MFLKSLLKRGITGFYRSGEEPVGTVEESFFKKACYIMDACGFPIITMCSPEPASYYEAQIIVGDKPMFMLMNKYEPIIAFCEKTSLGKKEFTDLDGEPLSEYGYRVADPFDLGEEFDNKNTALSPVEAEQAKYHKAQTAGEIIFNEWD